MTAIASTSSGPETYRNGYQPSVQSRYFGIAAVLLLHIVFIALLLWRGVGLSDLPGPGGGVVGELTVFELYPVDRSTSPPRKGGGDDPGVVELRTEKLKSDVESEHGGAGNQDDRGVAVLGDELAQLLADDPVSGGARADYETILRRHIAAHGRAPADSRGRRHTGTVIVRFRVARDGQIIDARVLKSRDSFLDEAALATLWRSEPMPSVPGNLDTPLEVDVPIDFQMRR